ncbi:hypothetical protein H9X88_13025 [Aeromonas hydrophila]|uniref:PD-(D/E)XK nuclease domain-containing protein n=1 Tax=Aeromonas TaxID=642 RepID=UPI00148B2019|nr:MULTISPECIES: hypothetical protein [Aeromonas]MBQ4677177.1 hypothetical protein [Aeromonas hydrophila]MBW3813781.1 hypothetical protein [Aeromonas hydrophila]MCF7679010.1 hypothetical protein [Aeromonas hydrophila]MCF7692058.1 hypothetical protein [Aeromonas hydrophila]MCF7772858.1 hypothetical protein [Aeromonas hydrophila]
MYEKYKKEIEDITENHDQSIFFLTDLESLTDSFSTIEQIYLFGSRRYPYQSLRSDIDLLLITSDYIRPADLRTAIESEPTLDLFTVSGGTATSCANESYISYSTQQELIERLDATLIWDKKTGFIEPANIKPFFVFRSDIGFKMSCLPSSFYKASSYEDKLKEIEKIGLPTLPIIGEDLRTAAHFLLNVAERMVFEKNKFSSSRGQAKNSWITSLKTEYDFQDLFEIVCRPFIPNMAREEVTITYDGSKKLSDFSFFHSQIIIEMKHIRTTSEVASTLKTLSGLSDFYKQNGNIKVLIFLIYINDGLNIDIARWEQDYSYNAQAPLIITKLIKNT